MVELIRYKDTAVSLRDVKVFERKYPLISVNVYGYEDDTLFPLFVSGKRRKFHANVLLHKKHFYPIRNLAPLVKRDCLVSRRKIFVCNFCLSYFFIFSIILLIAAFLTK